MSASSEKIIKNLNFVIFINRKCLRTISSVKARQITKAKTEYIFLYYISNQFTKVHLIKERQEETHSLLGKKNESHWVNLSRGNECLPAITITWIQLSYLPRVALLLLVSGQMPLEENCLPVRVGVFVNVRISFRVGGQPDNCPRAKLPPG